MAVDSGRFVITFIESYSKPLETLGADGGTRTRTPLWRADFKSAAYTISPRPHSLAWPFAALARMSPRCAHGRDYTANDTPCASRSRALAQLFRSEPKTGGAGIRLRDGR